MTEEGAVLKKGSSISSVSVQDSPKEDRYPLKEIQEFSGTGNKICTSLNLQIKHQSKVSFWQGK